MELVHQESWTTVPSVELQEKQVWDLQNEMAKIRPSLGLWDKSRTQWKLWSPHFEGMLPRSIASGWKCLCVESFQEPLPKVPLVNEQNHQEWLFHFQRAVAEDSAE